MANVQITDVYGNTTTVKSSEAASRQADVERDKALLEAAQSGDYSAVTANVQSNERQDVIRNANRILDKVNSFQGVNTGDYSGASTTSPMLYESRDYSRTFNDGKGYLVHDSVTEEDGTQYLAVGGKNSSFIIKVNADGTHERVESVSKVNSTGNKKKGTRGKNRTRLLGAFDEFKQGLSSATDTSTETSTTTTTTEAAVSKLADAVYLSSVTGVATEVMNELKVAAGLTAETPINSSGTGEAGEQSVQALLEEYGYRVGDQGTFYNNSTLGGPKDAGAVAYNDAYQTAISYGYLESTADNFKLYAGLTNEETGEENRFMVNDNIANQVLIRDLLKDSGEESIALKPVGDFDGIYDKKYLDQEQTINQQYQVDATGDLYNSLQWAEILKKLKIKEEDDDDLPGVSSSLNPTAQVDIAQDPTANTGQTGSFFTPNTTGYISTPLSGTSNVGTSTPAMTGVTQQQIPTFQQGLENQEDSFIARSNQQQNFYQPQTPQEQFNQGQAPAFEMRLYRNSFGMTMYVQHINGKPTQPIPAGYYLVPKTATTQTAQTAQTTQQQQGQTQGQVQGQYQGGMVQSYFPGGLVVQDGTQFKIQYPDGRFSQLYATLAEANAARDATDMNQLKANAEANAVANSSAPLPPVTADINQSAINTQQEVTKEDLSQFQRNLTAQAYGAPQGAIAASPTSYIDPNTYGSVIEATAGQSLGVAPIVRRDEIAQMGTGVVADAPTEKRAADISADKTQTGITSATATMSAANLDQPSSTITAQQQNSSGVSGLAGVTSSAVNVQDAPTRELRKGPNGEIVVGTGVDQGKVSATFGTGEVQASSVQDELASLMQQFEGGNTPAWAAGSMRRATAVLAERGLGASSLAGQAVVQAAMEAALPIAQIDAGNKQQMALFKAEQRAKFLGIEFDQTFQAKVKNATTVSEIANMQFSADQQVALENSRAINTMQLQNLSNRQAVVMAEAAALSQLDISNLNNRQQAQVQNAQNFLQVDMGNLSNDQQTALFKQQSLINSILSDSAAENAVNQFNATSENQSTQFFSNLKASVNQFNAAQLNAMQQFNADEVNTLLEFNAELQDVRERFNAQNYLAVAQANAQWRQNIATINSSAANESNMAYAQNVNGLTMRALDEIWMRERDILSMAFQISENNAQRSNAVVLEKLQVEGVKEAAKLEADIQAAANSGNFLKEVFKSIVGIG